MLHAHARALHAGERPLQPFSDHEDASQLSLCRLVIYDLKAVGTRGETARGQAHLMQFPRLF